MTPRKRVRRVSSVKVELLRKSREAALAAVQIFNNPSVTFKSETYVVLMIIAWTYLLHAYYRQQKVDYRYFRQPSKRKQYDRTRYGAYKHWQLERCLNDAQCPLGHDVIQNLKFLVGLRHEIEHQMTTRIDDLMSARFQSCCINYDEAIASLFGAKYGIVKHLALSLQLSSLTRQQVDTLEQHAGLPGHIRKYIEGFDGALAPEDLASTKFAYRVMFMPKLVNNPNQADKVIAFVKPDSDIAKTANAAYAAIHEIERPKWLPSQIVAKMKAEGFPRFGMNRHTELWKSREAKNPSKGYGVPLAKTWYWYDTWLTEVRNHCNENADSYR